MKVFRLYHFGAPGVLYVVVTLLMAIGAANSQNNLLFLAFSIAIGAGIASGLLSGAMMMGVSAERTLPAAAAVGAPMTIRYSIHNRNRILPLLAVSIAEHEGKAARLADRSAWRRFIPAPRAALLHLAPGDTTEITVVVTPTRRGVARLAGMRLTSAFPFGFIRKSVIIESRATLVIAPRSERLRRDASANLLTRSQSGLASAPTLGRGDEFYGVREYVAGDSPRLISWRASARVGSLVVREQTAPTAGSLWVVLNLNAPAGESASIEDDPTERAVVLCASLVDAAISSGVEAGFAAPDAGVIIPPSSAPRQRPAIMTALARLDPSAKDNPRSLAPVAHRSACIVVHSGGIDPSFGPSGARHLDASDLQRLAIVRAAERAGAAEPGV